LAKEALTQIAKAEKDGKDLKYQASETAKGIIRNSVSDGEKIIAQKISEAKLEADKILATSLDEAKTIAQEAFQKAQTLGNSLKEKISQNEAAVIDGVFKILL